MLQLHSLWKSGLLCLCAEAGRAHAAARLAKCLSHFLSASAVSLLDNGTTDTACRTEARRTFREYGCCLANISISLMSLLPPSEPLHDAMQLCKVMTTMTSWPCLAADT